LLALGLQPSEVAEAVAARFDASLACACVREPYSQFSVDLRPYAWGQREVPMLDDELSAHILGNEWLSIPSYRCRAQLDIACFLAKEAGGSCGAEIEALRERLRVLAALQAGNITIFEAFDSINSSDPRGSVWTSGLGTTTHTFLMARAFLPAAQSCTGAHPFWTERAISRALEPPTLPTWELDVDDLALYLYLQPEEHKFTPELVLAFYGENMSGSHWFSPDFNSVDLLMERFNLTYGRAKEIIEVFEFYLALVQQPIKYHPFFPSDTDHSLRVHVRSPSSSPSSPGPRSHLLLLFACFSFTCPPFLL
ncbi:MAG: hypothetical protein SGPRY_012332, partial [Prymnesium sp.]